MIYLHDAIYTLNPSVVSIRQNVAYDKDENVVEYNLATAEAKLVELQAAKTATEAAEAAAKISALSKLSALGLTDAEIKALTGTT